MLQQQSQQCCIEVFSSFDAIDSQMTRSRTMDYDRVRFKNYVILALKYTVFTLLVTT